jgi:heptosyltransferase II
MKVLLVQTGFLGDTVLSTPVISGIKALHADAEIWCMTTSAARELVARDPLLAGVLTFDKRRGESGLSGLWRKARELRLHNFDRAYCVHRSYRSALLLRLAGIPYRAGFRDASLAFLYSRVFARNRRDHDVLRRLAILSGESPVSALPQELRLFAPPLAEASPDVRGFVQRGRYVAVVPGSAWATKRWNKAGYREVVRMMEGQGLKVALLGSAEEAELCAEVASGLGAANLAGKSLSDLLVLIKGASLVVCNDSLALHIASAFKVPVVAVFCATSPEFGFGPWRTKSAIVERRGLACKPCAPHGGMRCPMRTEACMRDVKAGEVLEAALKLLEERHE